MIRIGITGGIGSGKSTVCRLFTERGIALYDSDREAKRLMTDLLREPLTGRFGEALFAGGALDRDYLAGIVFGDPQALADLNAIVHPAVIADFEVWTARQSGPYLLVESAILFESGLADRVDHTVAVLAPERLRIERVCRRDGSDPGAVARRMAAQLSDDELRRRADYCLVNIHEEDLEPAVKELDSRFRHESALHGA